MARLILPLLIVAALLVIAWRYAADYLSRHPQDVPWTALRLDDPIGAFTLRKLAGLTGDADQCRRLLQQAGVEAIAAPPLQVSVDCAYADGVRLAAPSNGTALVPAGLVSACPVAAALIVWERQVLQPAALRHFGRRITAIHHAGSFSCRPVAGRADGRFSEHATADAIDITGFTLADGRRIGVLEHWRGGRPNARFLRDARDGACRLFATVLSPDYNAAHADHLHFDQAERGRSGTAFCR